jgi:hypothetical protein
MTDNRSDLRVSVFAVFHLQVGGLDMNHEPVQWWGPSERDVQGSENTFYPEPTRGERRQPPAWEPLAHRKYLDGLQ